MSVYERNYAAKISELSHFSRIVGKNSRRSEEGFRVMLFPFKDPLETSVAARVQLNDMREFSTNTNDNRYSLDDSDLEGTTQCAADAVVGKPASPLKMMRYAPRESKRYKTSVFVFRCLP